MVFVHLYCENYFWPETGQLNSGGFNYLPPSPSIRTVPICQVDIFMAYCGTVP